MESRIHGSAFAVRSTFKTFFSSAFNNGLQVQMKHRSTRKEMQAREGLVKEALAQIAQGSSYRLVARQFRLSRKFLTKRVKEQDTSDWVKNPRGRGSKVMSKEEEWRFAESLRKQFNDSGKLLEWQTLKSLLQRHLQNLVQANPARLTGFEESNQKPTTGYTRRFDN